MFVALFLSCTAAYFVKAMSKEHCLAVFCMGMASTARNKANIKSFLCLAVNEYFQNMALTMVKAAVEFGNHF